MGILAALGMRCLYGGHMVVGVWRSVYVIRGVGCICDRHVSRFIGDMREAGVEVKDPRW